MGSSGSESGGYKPPKFINKRLRLGADLSEEALRAGAPQLQFRPFSIVPEFSPQTQQAIGLLSQPFGSPVENLGLQQAQQTLSGQFLDPASNPFLQRTFETAAGNVQNQIASSFLAGNSLNSGAAANALADAQQNLAASIFGENFQNERARQIATLGLLPGLAGVQQAPTQRLLQAGGLLEGLSGAQLAEEAERFAFEQQQQQVPLDTYINRITQLAGFAGQRPISTGGGFGVGGAATGALGGAATGAALGSVIPGLGTAVGAIGGGLLGGLGGGFG